MAMSQMTKYCTKFKRLCTTVAPLDIKPLVGRMKRWSSVFRKGGLLSRPAGKNKVHTQEHSYLFNCEVNASWAVLFCMSLLCAKLTVFCCLKNVCIYIYIFNPLVLNFRQVPCLIRSYIALTRKSQNAQSERTLLGFSA